MRRPNLKSVRVGDEIYVRVGGHESKESYRARVSKVTASYVYTAEAPGIPKGKFCKLTGQSCGKSKRSAWVQRLSYMVYAEHMQMLRDFYRDLMEVSPDQFNSVKIAKIRKLLNMRKTR